ncbi:hypothetical protein EV193_10658 [Herbihabitans rhizosphaerae]|uniref:DUF6801 domain-containing protein n=1 Tax=Herbihabitans rhizosphaerae TaxID=1872711 RepID=A0A4Q7KKT3_9PSEU|nr:DUF6801 domain-containing protein [Herbihabitans rhizosphaerae]RZS36824.1 hypothetical protein EV193_10658 [Herbihabitans rhizosphaerae]
MTTVENAVPSWDAVNRLKLRRLPTLQFVMKFSSFSYREKMKTTLGLRSRRILTGVAAGALVAGMMGFVGTGSGSAAGSTLAYTCALPVVGEQPMTAKIEVTPDSVSAGQETVFDFKATIALPEAGGLSIVGAKALEGSFKPVVKVTAPGVEVPPVQISLKFPTTPIPSLANSWSSPPASPRH